jgi:hypothetical protein
MGQLARASTAYSAEMISLQHIAMTALTAWIVILAGFMIYALIAV